MRNLCTTLLASCGRRSRTINFILLFSVLQFIIAPSIPLDIGLGTRASALRSPTDAMKAALNDGTKGNPQVKVLVRGRPMKLPQKAAASDEIPKEGNTVAPIVAVPGKPSGIVGSAKQSLETSKELLDTPNGSSLKVLQKVPTREPHQMTPQELERWRNHWEGHRLRIDSQVAISNEVGSPEAARKQWADHQQQRIKSQLAEYNKATHQERVGKQWADHQQQRIESQLAENNKATHQERVKTEGDVQKQQRKRESQMAITKQIAGPPSIYVTHQQSNFARAYIEDWLQPRLNSDEFRKQFERMAPAPPQAPPPNRGSNHLTTNSIPLHPQNLLQQQQNWQHNLIFPPQGNVHFDPSVDLGMQHTYIGPHQGYIHQGNHLQEMQPPPYYPNQYARPEIPQHWNSFPNNPQNPNTPAKLIPMADHKGHPPVLAPKSSKVVAEDELISSGVHDELPSQEDLDQALYGQA